MEETQYSDEENIARQLIGDAMRNRVEEYAEILRMNPVLRHIPAFELSTLSVVDFEPLDSDDFDTAIEIANAEMFSEGIDKTVSRGRDLEPFFEDGVEVMERVYFLTEDNIGEFFVTSALKRLAIKPKEERTFP